MFDVAECIFTSYCQCMTQVVLVLQPPTHHFSIFVLFQFLRGAHTLFSYSLRGIRFKFISSTRAGTIEALRNTRNFVKTHCDLCRGKRKSAFIALQWPLIGGQKSCKEPAREKEQLINTRNT